jgi:hypothetical protein
MEGAEGEGDVSAAEPFGSPPSSREPLDKFETSDTRVEAPFARIRAYVHPPVTGLYRFWVDGAVACQLLLSPDDSPKECDQVARIPNEGTELSFDPRGSILIKLTAGRKYYIEARQNSPDGVGRCAVSWQPPEHDRVVIDSEYLSPYESR